VSNYTITVFLDAGTNVRGAGLPNPVLYVEPDGWHGPGNISFQMPSRCSAKDRVKIAETFLKGVREWHDKIVAEVEQDRRSTDELAEARAEIARLKAVTEEVA
jgi:hypothetical protein